MSDADFGKGWKKSLFDQNPVFSVEVRSLYGKYFQGFSTVYFRYGMRCLFGNKNVIAFFHFQFFSVQKHGCATIKNEHRFGMFLVVMQFHFFLNPNHKNALQRIMLNGTNKNIFISSRRCQRIRLNV